MISGLSTINVTNQDISLNLIFNRPFIYLDTSKIKVWAKKDDEHGEELVTAKTILTDGQKYVERKSVFFFSFGIVYRYDVGGNVICVGDFSARRTESLFHHSSLFGVVSSHVVGDEKNLSEH